MFMHVALAAVALLLDPSRGSEPSRVVGVADLHGDFDHTIRLLEGAGLIDIDSSQFQEVVSEDGVPFSKYRGGIKWIGGNSTLVQTGDLVDRGTYARDLYALFASLRVQANDTGGRVVNLIGNHDMINMINDLRYVSKADIAEFGGSAKRAEAFAPTGWIGRQILEDFQAAIVVGNTLFVHAGLLSADAEAGVDELNAKANQQLRAAIAGGRRTSHFHLLRGNGPFWLRRIATEPEYSICDDVTKTLALVGAKRMVIGHSQVDEGVVRKRCGKRVLMADTIISKSAYPMCWHKTSMSLEGCRAALTYVEILGDDAFAVEVPVDEHATEISTRQRVTQDEL